MIAGVAVIATLLLSTHAYASQRMSEDAFVVPALSLVQFSVDEEHSAPTPSVALASLTGVARSAMPARGWLLHSSPTTGGFLGDAGMRKRRSAYQRSVEEEALHQQYLGYAIIFTGAALVVVGGIGLLAASKGPPGTAGSTALLGLGAIAGGGFLIYWGYQYKQEADTLSWRRAPAPLMVGYAHTF